MVRGHLMQIGLIRSSVEAFALDEGVFTKNAGPSCDRNIIPIKMYHFGFRNYHWYNFIYKNRSSSLHSKVSLSVHG